MSEPKPIKLSRPMTPKMVCQRHSYEVWFDEERWGRRGPPRAQRLPCPWPDCQNGLPKHKDRVTVMLEDNHVIPREVTAEDSVIFNTVTLERREYRVVDTFHGISTMFAWVEPHRYDLAEERS